MSGSEDLLQRIEDIVGKICPEDAGYMERYRKHLRPACEGAVLDQALLGGFLVSGAMSGDTPRRPLTHTWNGGKK